MLLHPRTRNDQRDSNRALVEAAPLQHHSVISEHLAVVAGKDDQGIVELSDRGQMLQQAPEFVVKLLDQGEITGAAPPRVRVVLPGRPRLKPKFQSLMFSKLIGII